MKTKELLQQDRIHQFFNLAEEDQAAIVEIYEKRKSIVSTAAFIKTQLDMFNRKYKDLQEQCEHPIARAEYKVDTDEYGRMMDSGTEHWHCPDCDKRWYETKYKV